MPFFGGYGMVLFWELSALPCSAMENPKQQEHPSLPNNIPGLLCAYTEGPAGGAN